MVRTMTDLRLHSLTLTTTPPQWTFDSATGLLSPRWVNPDGSMFPIVPFTLGHSDCVPALPAVEYFVQNTKIIVSGDSATYFAMFHAPIHPIVGAQSPFCSAFANPLFRRSSSLNSELLQPRALIVMRTI